MPLPPEALAASAELAITFARDQWLADQEAAFAAGLEAGAAGLPQESDFGAAWDKGWALGHERSERARLERQAGDVRSTLAAHDAALSEHSHLPTAVACVIGRYAARQYDRASYTARTLPDGRVEVSAMGRVLGHLVVEKDSFGIPTRYCLVNMALTASRVSAIADLLVRRAEAMYAADVLHFGSGPNRVRVFRRRRAGERLADTTDTWDVGSRRDLPLVEALVDIVNLTEAPSAAREVA